MVMVIDHLMIKIDAITKGIENQIMGLQNMFLGMGLAFLFTGMALSKFFKDIMRGLLETFLLVEGETGPVNEAVNNLKAGFLFLKFQFFDAFKQTGLFDIWLDRINRITNALNMMGDEQKATLVDFAIKGFLVGTAMMVAGMAMLFLLGPLSLIMFLIPKISAAILFLAANPVVLLVGGILAIVIVLALMIKKMGGFGNFMKAVFNGLLRVLIKVGGFLVDLILNPILLILNAASRIASFAGQGDLASKIGSVAGQLSTGRAGIERDLLRKTDININIEGNADESTVDKLIGMLETKILGETGSTQLG